MEGDDVTDQSRRPVTVQDIQGVEDIATQSMEQDVQEEPTSSSQLAEAEEVTTDFAGRQFAKLADHAENDSAVGMEAGTGLANAVDRFLQKKRSELMYELRRLQHGDRPVTGQGNREVVEEFLNQALHSADHSPGSAPSPNQRRPDAVVVEVNALVERRPVSSVLQSRPFRNALERALLGALTVRARRPDNPSYQPSLSQPSVAISHNRTTVTQTPPTASYAERTTNSAELYHSTDEEPANVSISVPPHVPLPPPLPLNRTTTDTIRQRVEEVPPQPVLGNIWQPPQVDPEEAQQQAVWENVEERNHDQVIEEISELLRQELVTSALDGTFRTILESHIRERVEATGTNGPQVAEFVRSLPQSRPVQRNDFSELGILGPQQQALSDDVSVISATAAVSIPYEQSVSAIRSEMRAMRVQMQEMQRLVRLSIDMQMDIQRSVKQEVSAALSQAGVASSAIAEVSRPMNDENCLICLDSATDTVIYQCGHMCVCYTCGLQLRQRGAHCPVCRAPIRDIMRVYRCNKS